MALHSAVSHKEKGAFCYAFVSFRFSFAWLNVAPLADLEFVAENCKLEILEKCAAHHHPKGKGS